MLDNQKMALYSYVPFGHIAGLGCWLPVERSIKRRGCAWPTASNRRSGDEKDAVLGVGACVFGAARVALPREPRGGSGRYCSNHRNGYGSERRSCRRGHGYRKVGGTRHHL